MKVFIINLFLVLFAIVSCLHFTEGSAPDVKCLNKIYRECTHESRFTAEELENVRRYLQRRFWKTRPIGKPCRRIHVRKDIKCLNKREFNDFVVVMKTLYRNGFIDRMSKIHNNVWPEVHKYGVGLPWHRWFLRLIEKEMMKINPKVTLPYWDYYRDFAEPHRSVVWDLFGHSGRPENNFCVTDGPFANITVRTTGPHCLRRQWRPDGSMHSWESPEWATAITQMGLDYPLVIKELHLLSNWSTFGTVPRSLKEVLRVFRTIDPTTNVWSLFAVGIAFVGHFKTHLSIGGFAGDMSLNFAPNDPIFYPFHAMSGDLTVLKWQLSDDKNLLPDNYGLGVKYDYKLKRTAVSDIYKDVLPYFSDITVKETFQYGFGELCYIQDQLVKPINELMRGQRRPIPKSVARLKSTLPHKVFANYFPKFAYYPQRVTVFDHHLSDIDDVDCNRRCAPTPYALNYLQTPEGIRFWHQFKNNLGMDLTLVVAELQKNYLKFMSYIRRYGYCSPYVL